MKKFAMILAIIMSLQSVQVSAADILQLGELFEHYDYHQKKFGDDFLTFLAKHYGEQKQDHQDNHQEEKQDHEKLPFHQDGQSNTQVAFTLPLMHSNPENAMDGISSHMVFHYHFLYTSPESSGIFHPPKIV